MVRRVLVLSVVVACGARTELNSTCRDCEDAGRDVSTMDVRPPPDAMPDVPTVAVCGNGVREPGEQCDLGSGNSDAPIPFHVSQGTGGFDVMPLARAESSDAFYDYIGASSHTGLEVQGESRLYLYIDSTTSTLSFIVNHNIFGAGTGRATMSITGLSVGFSVVRSDDAGELTASGPITAMGDWSWSKNTDGGVIGGLACPAPWSITASADFAKGISSWVWVNEDTSRTPLTMGEPVTIQSFARCTTRCTIPACGD